MWESLYYLMLPVEMILVVKQTNKKMREHSHDFRLIQFSRYWKNFNWFFMKIIYLFLFKLLIQIWGNL